MDYQHVTNFSEVVNTNLLTVIELKQADATVLSDKIKSICATNCTCFGK